MKNENENDIAFEAWFKSHTKGIATTFTHAHWAKKGWDARSEKMNRVTSQSNCIKSLLVDVKPCLLESEVRVGEYSNIIKRIDEVLVQQH